GQCFGKIERRGKQRGATAWMEPTLYSQCKHRQYPYANRRGTFRDASAGRQAGRHRSEATGTEWKVTLRLSACFVFRCQFASRLRVETRSHRQSLPFSLKSDFLIQESFELSDGRIIVQCYLASCTEECCEGRDYFLLVTKADNFGLLPQSAKTSAALLCVRMKS